MTRPKTSYRRRCSSQVRRKRTSRAGRAGQRKRRAQKALAGLEQLLEELVLPTGLEKALRRRLKAQSRLLAQLFAMMLPTAFGARTYGDVARIFGWSKNRAGQLLGALSATGWQRKLRRLGREVVNGVLGRLAKQSPATRSRWQLNFAVDSTVIRKYGQFLGLAAPAYSGQVGTTVNGLDVVLLVAVFGDGRLVVPLDVQIHRPKHQGPGRPGDDKLIWTEKLFERAVSPLKLLEPPTLLGDSWFGSSKLQRYMETQWQGRLLVQGKGSWVLYPQNGTKFKGSQIFEVPGLQWRLHPDLPGWSYARLRARSPSFGRVLLTLVRPPKDKPYYLLCSPTTLPSTRLIQQYRRRSSIEWCFRVLKHLLAVGLCQVRNENAIYGQLVLRLMGLTLLSSARQRHIANGATIEQMLFGIAQHYKDLDSKILQFKELSSLPYRKSASRRA